MKIEQVLAAILTLLMALMFVVLGAAVYALVKLFLLA